LKSRISNLISRLKIRRPENLKIVALSISTAAIFWLFTALSKDYDTTVGYPVTWQFDAEEYIVIDELPGKIRMNVSGLGWSLLRASFGFKVKPVTIVLNNPTSSKKIAGVSLTNKVNDQLEELKLNHIVDDTLAINIDKRGVRSFGVYIDSANISLEENYRIISSINSSVDLMELEGPISMINSIASDRFLLHIKENQLSNDFDEEINFTIERPELFLFRPKSAHISFSVAEFVEAERQVVLTQINIPNKTKAHINDTLCTVKFLVRKDREAEVVADSFKIIANYLLLNKQDSSLLLSVEKSPLEAINVRLALPQIRLNYDE